MNRRDFLTYAGVSSASLILPSRAYSQSLRKSLEQLTDDFDKPTQERREDEIQREKTQDVNIEDYLLKEEDVLKGNGYKIGVMISTKKKYWGKQSLDKSIKIEKISPKGTEIRTEIIPNKNIEIEILKGNTISKFIHEISEYCVGGASKEDPQKEDAQGIYFTLINFESETGLRSFKKQIDGMRMTIEKSEDINGIFSLSQGMNQFSEEDQQRLMKEDKEYSITPEIDYGKISFYITPFEKENMLLNISSFVINIDKFKDRQKELDRYLHEYFETTNNYIQRTGFQFLRPEDKKEFESQLKKYRKKFN